MTFPATLLTLTLSGGGALLPFSDEVQPIEVDGTPAVEVHVLTRQVRIAGAASRAKRWHRKGLCPRAHADGADLVLECTSAHLHARVISGEVSIYRLRGLPWGAKDEP